MNKYQATDDTQRELWAIKTETAARYKTVVQYFAHLALATAAKHVPGSPQPILLRKAVVKPKSSSKAKRVVLA